ncbi:hypothetical protein BOX15_Mlig007632g1 [Macrostomum lignano]|uniref:JmjC domain-containing protein n=1 Tax=Macrostomum lignano TaxID=282301 RepID=A0A267DWQ0_9PLAT|nr:hypothetical protein BOX15_Mlig007632g1 [Macrostomum lignano]
MQSSKGIRATIPLRNLRSAAPHKETQSNMFLVLLLLVAEFSNGEKHPLFEKDHAMDTVFPPVIWKHPELPAGHLRSLGYQRHADGPVKVASRLPSPVEFYAEYVLRLKPLVLRDAIDKSSPMMDRWTDEYLKRHFGQHKVTVTHKKEIIKGQVEVMTLERFLDRYKFQDLYMASLIPAEMEAGFTVPHVAQCGPVSRHITEAEMWMSSGGTGSLLHYHSEHQLHCMADGRKDFILIEHKYKDNLKCVEQPPGSGNGASTIDVDMVNMFDSPDVEKTPWRYTTLLPGDCLFIPAGHLHQVRSYGRSLSYTFLFRPVEDKNLGDCRALSKAVRGLDQFDLVWTIKDGYSQLKNEKLDADSLRSVLLSWVGKDGGLTFPVFQRNYEKAVAKAAGDSRSIGAKRAFQQLLQSEKKQVLTKDALMKLPAKTLDKLALFLNSIHKTVRDEL